jgi:hypothetical protein
VLLLVVLSMLVLFLLLGTTFLLTSGQYRTAAKIVEKSHRTTFQPADLLERALMQLVRDTNNSSSVIRYHSLLRDMYGVDGFMARVNVAATIAADPSITPTPPTPIAPPSIGAPHYAGVTTATATTQPRGTTEGQVVEFYVLDAENQSVLDSTDANAVGLDIDANGMPANHTLAKVSGYYEGCVLTFTTGPCRGSSVRVIDYEYRGAGASPRTVTDPGFTNTNVGPVGRFRVMVPRRVDGRSLTITNGVITDLLEGTQGSRFIVNGRPFSGAGVGLNPLAMSSANPEAPLPRLSALELVGIDGTNGYGMERALIPNSVHNLAVSFFLDPAAGIDPWAQIYNEVQLRPLTRNFVDPRDPSVYNPETSPLYKTFAGPGDTNESYDAPDSQNMALAMQALEPRLRGRVVAPPNATTLAPGVSYDPDAYYAAESNAPAYLDLEGVTLPSFHRPELANFWFHRMWRSQWLTDRISDPSARARMILEPFVNGAPRTDVGLSAADANALGFQIATLKRKFLMRPLREDHPSFDGSNPLSAYGTPSLRTALNGGDLVNDSTGEITFPYWEAVGPWDVDNDGDGVNDSVWVDIGLPVQQTEDGRWYKPLVAMLVEDLDGRLNLNAHGSESDMAQADLDASQRVDTSGGVINQLGTNLAYDYNAGASLNSSNQLPGGVGWGVAETSLRPILSPTLPMLDVMNGSARAGDAQFDDYARTLYGRPDPSTAGRNPSVALRESVTFGRYGSLPGTAQTHAGALEMQLRYSVNYDFAGGLPASASSVVSLTKPGITFPIDPAVTAPATMLNTLTAVRDQRTPLEYLGYPRYTGAEHRNSLEILSGFSSAPDLGGRYAVGLSGAGASVDEPRSAANVRSDTIQLSWRELAPAAVDDSPYELDLSIGARNRPPASLDDVRRSYDPNLTGAVQTQATPISDDAPFSAAELERILRAFDGDAQKLPDRLWKAVDAFDPAKKAAANRLLTADDDAGYTPNSLELVVAGAEAAVTRRQVTTDSWDLPVPNENLYDRLLLGADGKPGVPEFQSIGTWVNSLTLPADDDLDGLMDEGDEAVTYYNTAGAVDFGNGPIGYDQMFNAGCDDYVVVMRKDPPKNARLTDYLKYRITLEMLRNGRLAVPPGALTPAQLATYHATIDTLTNPILFGGELAATAPANLGSIGGLLSSELLAGRRMDLNRPFGDGRDNNGNGVVDEMEEAGEPYADSNGNGRYDANEPYLDLNRSGDYTASQDRVWIDTDGDGVEEQLPFRHVPLHETFVDRNGARIYNPQMARQLFARHLYCLMLALTDENYLAPYDSDDPQVLHYTDPLSGTLLNNVASAESSEAFRIAFDLHAIAFSQEIADRTVTANHTVTITDPALESRRLIVLNRARQIAQRKLTCRMIAQWAINVVDFRDPDSIQTAFEYDENPWDGWNIVDTLNGGVYPLDGDLSTDENLTMHREVTGGVITPPQLTRRDINNNSSPRISAEEARRWVPRKDWTRGVVWGAERPEVLLTEGIAWHDRRLEDLEVQQTNSTPENNDGKVSNTPGPGKVVDDDLDQLRKPKGHAYIEAYNPHTGDDQRPAELYSHVNRQGEVTSSPGVRLDRLSNVAQDPAAVDPNDLYGRNRTRSPVWRIAVVEEHPLVRNATPGATGATLGSALAGQASDDPPIDQVQGLKGNGNKYLNVTILNGPWQYGVASTGQTSPVLPKAYFDFHIQRGWDSGFALLTTAPEATGEVVFDADGIGVAAGVIERAPTVPDTSFPAFDSFAQPFNPQQKTLVISSKIDGTAGGAARTILRGVLSKPTTFIERVFYMAAADAAPRTGSTGPPQPTANPTDPGLRVPLLTYDVPANYTDGNRFNAESLQVGVTTAPFNSGAKMVRVFASKYAAAFDRLDINRDGPEAKSYEEILATPPAAPVGFAPLMPGRRAVIGTTGDIYKVDDTTVTPDANDLANPFDGPVAKRMAGRYAALISQKEGQSSPVGPEAPNVPSKGSDLRRFEMIPNPDPNRHQFAIRMNGLNESLSILQNVDELSGDPAVEGAGSDSKSDAFNLTGGQASGQADTTLMAAPPVIAIPIDHFSISEPLDEYLVRQIELDQTLSHYPQPSYKVRNNTQSAPNEDYFAKTSGNADPYHFDEPFDVLPELIENQTTPNYRSVHLQRLANPLLPWNPPPVRPDGQVIAQHDPNLPVNPYLPVDARSLDLTAFNSYTDAEKLVSDQAPSAPNTAGPEYRHKTRREFEKALGSGTDRKTAIGFASNERERPLGPFPLKWMMEPSRLLWRQSAGSTISEIAHQYALQSYNGYLSKAGDQIAKSTVGPATGRLGMEGTLYDSLQISSSPYDYASLVSSGTPYSKLQYMDVAWRVTLGFTDWMWGESQSGSGLVWHSENGPEGPMEQIDLDGDRNGLDLSGRPEVNIANTGATQQLAANGRTAAVNNASLNGQDARTFMESYLRNRAAEQGTTPEFTWPNRPLASAGELLQVPAWGGSRMLTYYSVFNWQYTQDPHFSRRTQVNPYDGEAQVYHDGLDFVPIQFNKTAPAFDGDFSNDHTATDQIRDLNNVLRPQAASTNVLRFRDMLGHFGHLMNFFQTARFPSTAMSYAYRDLNNKQVEAVVPRGASHFYRVLDYVCVPSRFTATDTILNLDTFSDAGMAINDPRQELAAPFNRVDNYREPGRVNLNTIVGRRDATEPQRVNLDNGAADGAVPRLPDYWSEVYDGLMQRLQDGSVVASGSLIKQGHLGPAWRDVALSRRGYVQAGFNPALSPLETSLQLSSARQNLVDYSPMRMHPDFPTLFANPFRAPGEGANVPLANMVQTGVDATMLRAHPLSPGADGAWGRRGVDGFTVNKSGSGTNAERNGNRNDAGEAGSLPMQAGDAPAIGVVDRLGADTVLARLMPDGNRRGAVPDTFMDDAFRARAGDPNPRNEAPQSGVLNTEISKRSTAVPLFSGASLEPSIDTERNSTQRYLPIQRMANLATTRSNVYAVWITVGFFEVKQAREAIPALTDSDSNGNTGRYFLANGNFKSPALQELFFRVYPDGWTLGEEIGRATGQDVRHRGFYVVDRSRPVAFKPGEDANVSETVLVRRRIQ